MRLQLYLILGSVVSSAVLVGCVFLYATSAKVLDVPNQRSSHTKPTPRGGGLGLIAAAIASWSVFAAIAGTGHGMAFGLLGASLAGLMIVGWLDDRNSVPVLARLLVHVVCGAAAALLIAFVNPASGLAQPLWLLWWGFWAVASINVVNFMDGIDGLVSSQALIYSAYVWLLTPQGSVASMAAIVLGGSCLGFLVWNWEPARIFLGDSGSGPLGFCMVIVGALASAGIARAPLVFVPLFLLYLDALATLVIRVRTGENPTSAHRSHLYQRMVAAGMSHSAVASQYGIVALIGAGAGVLAIDARAPMATAIVCVYVVSVAGLWFGLHRRFPPVQEGAGMTSRPRTSLGASRGK